MDETRDNETEHPMAFLYGFLESEWAMGCRPDRDEEWTGKDGFCATCGRATVLDDGTPICEPGLQNHKQIRLSWFRKEANLWRTWRDKYIIPHPLSPCLIPGFWTPKE